MFIGGDSVTADVLSLEVLATDREQDTSQLYVHAAIEPLTATRMDNRELNPYEPSIDNAVAPSPTPGNSKHLATLILSFELPVVLLLVHGISYLFDVPGSEVSVNEYGGKQPVAFMFFRFLSIGGLHLLLIFGCWQSTQPRMNTCFFGLCNRDQLHYCYGGVVGDDWSGCHDAILMTSC